MIVTKTNSYDQSSSYLATKCPMGSSKRLKKNKRSQNNNNKMIFTPKANKGHQIVRVSCTTSSLGKKNALPFEFLALRSAPLNRCSKTTEHFSIM